MSRERLVVIGADAGGMTAASQARRRRGAESLEIIAIDRGRHASYSACGIPYWIGGLVGSVDALVARTVDEFRKQDIEVRLRQEAVGLDLDAGVVTVHDHETGGDHTLSFDQLVLGTGAIPVRPDIAGIDAPGVYGVQTLDDGEAVRAAVAGDGARRAVVVGGGYIGLEMAEAFVERGLEVTVVEAAPQPMSTLDPDVGALSRTRSGASASPCSPTSRSPRSAPGPVARPSAWSPRTGRSPRTSSCSDSACGPTPRWPGTPESRSA